jgi:hypothetical protein
MLLPVVSNGILDSFKRKLCLTYLWRKCLYAVKLLFCVPVSGNLTSHDFEMGYLTGCKFRPISKYNRQFILSPFGTVSNKSLLNVK